MKHFSRFNEETEASKAEHLKRAQQVFKKVVVAVGSATPTPLEKGDPLAGHGLLGVYSTRGTTDKVTVTYWFKSDSVPQRYVIAAGWPARMTKIQEVLERLVSQHFDESDSKFMGTPRDEVHHLFVYV